MSLNQLQLRLISALVMLVAVAIILWLGATAFTLLVGLLLTAMVAEWLRLLSTVDRWPMSPTFVAGLLFAFIAFVCSASFSTIPMLLTNLGVSLVLIAVNLKKIEKKWMVIWPPYIALACSLTLVIYLKFGPLSLLWLLGVVWATDIGAYFTGRSLGGPKLMPSVSPNKTWSGAIGGVVAATLVSLVFVLITNHPTSLITNYGLIVASAICISVCSQVGDLLESFAKRQHNIKDSSNLIPGHGGVLDRLDGLLPTIPVAFVFLAFLA